jgi:hypothetical protein
MKLGDLVRVVIASRWQGMVGIVVEKTVWGGWKIVTPTGLFHFERCHLEIVQ